ncbi:sulfotransferase domain-containing protein [Bauldia sp.]|uniref:sulfotransferase domain-containing protein n=1 Tax=Bauldia sp. TaxID=2575872 RepID=UPI003BA9BDB1
MITFDPAKPRGIVWIASYPKSGNTWIRVFLHHLFRMADGRPLEDYDLDSLSRTSTVAFGRVDLFERFMEKPILESDPVDIAFARPKVQQAMVDEEDRVIFVKTHSFLGRVFDQPLINRAVSSGAIYIVRNPLDVAVSLQSYLGVSLDSAIRSMGASLNASPTVEIRAQEIWGSWTENVGSWTTNSPPVVHVVRYEDLLADTRNQFDAIVRHLRLDVTPEQVEEALALSSFDRLQAQEAATGFIERPSYSGQFFRAGKAGQWRDVLSPEQIDRIVSDHGEQMSRFGYLPN